MKPIIQTELLSDKIFPDFRGSIIGLWDWVSENSDLLKKTLLQNNHEEELLARPHIWGAGGQVCLY